MLSMYDQGASDREIMKEIGVSAGVFKMLYSDVDCDFKAMVDFGRLRSHAWWESLGRKNLENTKFQTALYKFNMSNRFGWTEKSTESLTNVEYKNLDNDSLKREISELMKELELDNV